MVGIEGILPEIQLQHLLSSETEDKDTSLNTLKNMHNALTSLASKYAVAGASFVSDTCKVQIILELQKLCCLPSYKSVFHR